MALITRKKIRNVYLKLIKQPGTPDQVARGVGIGFFLNIRILPPPTQGRWEANKQ